MAHDYTRNLTSKTSPTEWDLLLDLSPGIDRAGVGSEVAVGVRADIFLAAGGILSGVVVELEGPYVLFDPLDDYGTPQPIGRLRVRKRDLRLVPDCTPEDMKAPAFEPSNDQPRGTRQRLEPPRDPPGGWTGKPLRRRSTGGGSLGASWG